MRGWALVLAAGLPAAWCPPDAFAQPSAEEAVIALDLPGTTLREALALIFNGSSVVVEWQDGAMADQIVKGHYEGSIQQIAMGLMARTDFIIAYDDGGGIARIAVMGRNFAAPDAPAPLPAQAVRVQSNKQVMTVKSAADRRRQVVREKILKKRQATNEAVRQRLASLPPGWQLLRTQAIMTVPSVYRGNIPLIPPRR